LFFDSDFRLQTYCIHFAALLHTFCSDAAKQLQ